MVDFDTWFVGTKKHRRRSSATRNKKIKENLINNKIIL